VKWRFSVPVGGVEGSKLCLFSVIMPAKCVSSVSPRFHYRRLAFCFLPLAAILESLLLSFFNLCPVSIPSYTFLHTSGSWPNRPWQLLWNSKSPLWGYGLKYGPGSIGAMSGHNGSSCLLICDSGLKTIPTLHIYHLEIQVYLWSPLLLQPPFELEVLSRGKL
jgi:hypothetical protein